MPVGPSSFSSSKPGIKAQASGSGTKRTVSHPDSPFSKPGAKPSGSTARRASSLPPHLPSNPFKPTEVKADRIPITRPKPDRRPPEEFREALGICEGAELKQRYMTRVEAEYFLGSWLKPKIESSPYYMGLLKSMHPKFESYNQRQVSKAYNDLVSGHPMLMANIAKKRNTLYGIPSYATSSRVMQPSEQKFLSKAMQLIKEEVEKAPFHMHGETSVVADSYGNIVEFAYSSTDSVSVNVRPGDKFAIHSHPPFGAPFDSSASVGDHRVAAETYLDFNNRMKEFLTNGRDVLHIQPDSLELVKLHPDPKLEKKIGKFPEAFRLPDPQQPPYPFSNHEAPVSFKKDWAPPAGWKPPEDYPRD